MSNTKAYNRVITIIDTVSSAITSDSQFINGNSYSIQLVHGTGGGASTVKIQTSHDQTNWDDEPSSEITVPATAGSFTWKVDGSSFPAPFVRLVITGDNINQTAYLFVRNLNKS